MNSYDYPDVTAVQRAFAASGKRHLVLTGGRGAGKSTLLSAFFGGEIRPGITTEACPGVCVTLHDNLGGDRFTVGRFDAALPGNERKMRAVPGVFDIKGAAILRRLAEADAAAAGEWVTLDEIGYLEADSADYVCALGALTDKKRVAAVVRREVLPTLSVFTDRDDVFVFDLDAPHGRTGCVIMASGMGVRFGGNKLMAPFHSKPMIAQILRATDGIFARRIVVTRHADVRTYCEALGADVLLHDLPGRNDTVRLGLAAVGEGTDACMFCPADQPLLRRSTVSALAMTAAGDPGMIYRAAFDGVPGAPAVFPAWAYPALSALPPGKGGGVVMKQYPDRVRTLGALDAWEMTDADTEEILRELENRK